MKLLLAASILASTPVAGAAPERTATAPPRYYVRHRAPARPPQPVASSPRPAASPRLSAAGPRSPDGSLTVSIASGDGMTRGGTQDGARDGDGAQIVWLTNNRTGERRRLLVSRYANDRARNLTGLSNPLFSLDGGYVYVSSRDDEPGSEVVHQLKLSTGAERAVTGGTALSVIRTGQYRGYLLVRQHRYRGPEGGSYGPVLVVRPDGHPMFVVPGSDADDGKDAVTPWLRAHGWTAS